MSARRAASAGTKKPRAKKKEIEGYPPLMNVTPDSHLNIAPKHTEVQEWGREIYLMLGGFSAAAFFVGFVMGWLS